MHSKSVNCKNTEHQSLFALPVTYISVTEVLHTKIRLKIMVIKMLAMSTYFSIYFYTLSGIMIHAKSWIFLFGMLQR